MTKTNYFCLDLDLGFDIDSTVIRHLSLDNMPVYGFKQFNVPKSSLDLRLVDLLKKYQVDVSHAEAFYTLPGKKLPIHTDHDVIDNHCKLNFVYGHPGSVMQWWKLRDKNKQLNYQLTTIGTKYLMFDSADCDLVWESQVGCPSLINAGQPHSVINCTDQPRITLSLVLYDLKKQQLLDWHDAVEIFRDLYE
jgi:hypothetical protein